MKIIVMNIPGHGHVNPTLPVVAGLVARGHTVFYYNTEEFRTKISATGANFCAYPANSLTTDAIPHAVQTHLANMTILLMEASLTLTAFMLDEIAREAPDLLIFDAICLWGNQAARLSGLPAVASIPLFVLEGAKLPFSWRDRWHMIGGALPRLPKLLRARNALVQRYGRASLQPHHLFPGTGDLNLIYTIRALQPPSQIIDDTFHFVGPSLSARQPESTLSLPEGRVTYISLGTIHTNPAFYAACFEAFANAPGTFVLVAGEDAAHLTPPPNFMVLPRAPQLELLARADLFITHAGINSLHESLYFGVPMVMVPQQMEQLFNARVAELHGVGVVVGGAPPYGQHVSAETLRAAADVALTTPSYRANAQRMAALLQATDGTAESIRLIEEFGAARGIAAVPVEKSKS